MAIGNGGSAAIEAVLMSMAATRRDGKVVVPGSPESSALYLTIAQETSPEIQMPPHHEDKLAMGSGAALTEMSTRIIAKIHEHTGGSIPIVGVGGIMGPEDAKAKIDAGATLVQIYTGLVYEGPGLVKRILRGLAS